MLAAAALFASAVPAGAEPTQIEHYLVGGATIPDLRDSIRASAPLGGRALGLTNVVIIPTFGYAGVDGTCRTVDVKVDVDTTVTLPKWGDASAMPDGFAERWAHIIGVVREHEMMHVKIAETYGERIATAIRTATSPTGCAKLREEVTAQVKELQEKHRQMQRNYDIIDKARVLALLP